MKKQIILLMLFIIVIVSVTSCGRKNNIVGSWEISGFPDFPFVEIYNFSNDKIVKLMRNDENGIKISEYTGIYSVSGNKLKITFDNEDMGTQEYIFNVNNSELILTDSSGDRMTYISSE